MPLTPPVPQIVLDIRGHPCSEPLILMLVILIELLKDWVQVDLGCFEHRFELLDASEDLGPVESECWKWEQGAGALVKVRKDAQ
ncbi:hypothetical protein A0H81_08078 [Grifola frondosa]|uniref:Uncharacterized protein n=1 Tax=Grifola frondosa TaxID=5627 RepID=A0A1C7M4D4_GRIFR|nr:hypothetical protein A0H81_08078 [Grifola frondosa]